MSADLNQTIAEASLDNLHDIIVPPMVGFFPLAPGWYIVFLLIGALVFHFGYQRYKVYEREQYRRDAEEELEALNDKNRENTIALLSLAKRVGLSVYGRETIATLDGDRWWDFMEGHILKHLWMLTSEYRYKNFCMKRVLILIPLFLMQSF